MKDLFTIPVTEGENKGKTIIYAPLKKIVRLAETAEDIEEIKSEIAGLPDVLINKTSTDPQEFRTLMILPNNKCNFRCSYCYSAKGRSNGEMNVKMLNTALEWFITPDRLPGKKLTIIYIGGGEPLLSWSIVRSSIEYAMELNQRRQGSLYISIVTNGSILNDEIVDFCKRTNVGICASYDILEETQNKYRGHYEEVTRNINTYSSEGVDVGITTVVTEENIHRMTEMITAMHESIPLVRQVSLKPLVPDDRFSKFASMNDYYQSFVENFFQAKAKADELGIRLTCPYYNAVSVIQDRFCEGKFVLSPEGHVTGCNFVSSPKEAQFDEFMIGKACEDQVQIDESRVRRVFSHNNSLEMCSDCPARYHCAGGCYADHQYMNSEHKETFCQAMRYFLQKYLEFRIAAQIDK